MAQDQLGAERIEMADAAQIGRGLRRWVPMAARMAESWDAAGRVIGRGEAGRRRYPLCQFDAEGLPLPQIGALRQALGGALCEEAQVRWLDSPCADLGGARPAALLARDPDAVLQAALRLSRADAA